MEKYLESYEKAHKCFNAADHLTYISYPIVKENKILLKVLEEISESLLNAINSILQYEYLNKRISIYNNPRDNFETFKKLAFRYNIDETKLNRINEIMRLAEKHKKSPFEFSKNAKIIIMDDDNLPEILNLEKIKIFLTETKAILTSLSSIFNIRKI